MPDSEPMQYQSEVSSTSKKILITFGRELLLIVLPILFLGFGGPVLVGDIWYLLNPQAYPEQVENDISILEPLIQLVRIGTIGTVLCVVSGSIGKVLYQAKKQSKNSRENNDLHIHL